MGKKRIINSISIMLITLIIGITLAVPTYAITFKWSISMSTNGRIVDGKKNGVYHKLSYGYVKIKGTIYTHSNKNGNGRPTNELHFQLYNKSTGNCFGDITKKPSGYAMDYVDFSGIYPKKVGGGNKYYLAIWRVDSDGTKLSADGSAYHYDYK